MCSGQVWVSINSIIVIMVELRVYSMVCMCVRAGGACNLWRHRQLNKVVH